LPTLAVAWLIKECGAEHGSANLLGTLAADCPRQQAHSIYDRCGAYYPQLQSIFTRTKGAIQPDTRLS
jgi:hypothetical protein